jgi:tol-pal system protein YbgF
MLTACVATKSDVRLLRTDLASLQARQDSLYRESLRNMGLQADSVRMLSESLRQARGQLSNQIRQLQEMLITIQELMGTNAQTVRQLREQLERQQQTPPVTTPPAQPGATTADAATLYATGRTKLAEKSSTAARLAFEELLANFPRDERAADAQLGIAETYVQDEDLAEAVTQFEKVAQAYPTSDRAPEALYRAGQISEERKRTSDARRFYNMVVSRYASSPSSSLARKRLQALPSR